jgi:hypothetical protein
VCSGWTGKRLPSRATLNVVRLDKERGEVALETDKLSSVTYRGGATLKGLFS